MLPFISLDSQRGGKAEVTVSGIAVCEGWWILRLSNRAALAKVAGRRWQEVTIGASREWDAVVQRFPPSCFL